MHPHLPGNVGEHDVRVSDAHAEARIGERFDHGAFEGDCFFFGQAVVIGAGIRVGKPRQSPSRCKSGAGIEEGLAF